MKRLKSRRSFVVASCVGVAAIGVVVGGAYALVGLDGDIAIGKSGATSQVTTVTQEATGTVVSRVENTAELDSEIGLITVPLGVKFKVAGQLYGTRAKQPIQLGPPGVDGMTQDDFGAGEAMLLPDGNRLLYPFSQQLRDFPDEAPGSEQVPDGTHICTPTIRLLDLATGEDRLLLSGARSMAYRADGKFAYAAGIDADYRYNIPYLQRVFVQDGLDGRPTAWTTDAGRYTVLQWAKDALFVQREYEGEATDVVAITEPGTMRAVVSSGDWLLAVSPDGSRIVVASGMLEPEGKTVLRVLEWETGREVCNLTLDGVLDPGSGQEISIGNKGSWEGEKIVVGYSPVGLAVLSMRDDKLALDEVIGLRYPRLHQGTSPTPLLSSDASKVFLVTHEVTSEDQLERTAVLAYDFASGNCTRWIVPGRPALTNLVFNPSRPR